MASADVQAGVKAHFERDMSRVDFAEVMVEVERIINASVDGDAMLGEIDCMATHIRSATPQEASEWDKEDAIRQYVYEPGYWNDDRSFEYDLDDPFALKFESRLFSVAVANQAVDVIDNRMDRDEKDGGHLGF